MKTLSAVYVAMVLTVAGQAWFTNYARSQDLVTIDNGKARCHLWPQYLREHPTELVKFTGKDQFGQKVKLLADKRGGYWRLALMAGAEDSMFGCFILEGTSWIGPDD